MIPTHPSHRYRRRYYRRVATAMGVAATLHVAAFVLSPAYAPHPPAMRPTPLRLVRLASLASPALAAPAEAPAAVTPLGPRPIRPDAPAAAPIVTEAAASVGVKSGGAPASIPSAAGAIEGEDAAPPVFYQYDKAPRVIRRVEPDYPPEARLRGEEGTVVVNANIDERGHVIRAWVVAKNASEALVNAVIDAVYQFEFTPGEERGIPVRCTVAIPFSFSLKRIP
ncbi:MAG: energy transducer TonB [Hyphomicrobiales bacterium]